MGISATGQTGLSMRGVLSMLVVVAILLGTIVYFYGPAVAPRVSDAARAECNEYAGGNFRSFRLEWVTGPGERPHWSCWDASRPEERAISLGWWVDPFRD